jgi:hypothetical protein
MRGNLADFRFESLLQVLVASKPTGVLSVQHPSGHTFQAYLVEGRLVHAVYDSHIGLDALAALLHDQSGTFEFCKGEGTNERSIDTAPEWALMQAVQKAEQLPPRLQIEVQLKKKTTTAPAQPAQARPADQRSLGRTHATAEPLRTVRARAGNNASGMEALASILTSPMSGLGSRWNAARQTETPSASIMVSTSTANNTGSSSTDAINTGLSKPLDEVEGSEIDLDFDDLPTRTPTPPKHPSNPSLSLGSHGSGTHAAPTAPGMPMIPINVVIASDPGTRASRLPERLISVWAEQLKHPVGRFELRKLMDRRGLILPVTADPNLEQALVIPADLAERLKITSGSVVWIGPG